MPPPDAETVELRIQLEGLVGKLKAKQEEVQSSASFKVSTRNTASRFPLNYCCPNQVRDDASLGSPGSK